MKKIKVCLIFLVFFFVGCTLNTKRIELFDTVTLKLPVSFALDTTKKNNYIDEEKNISVLFRMTKNKSLGKLTNVNFDLLYSNKSNDSITVKNKEIKEIHGMRFGIKRITNTKFNLIFFTEIKNEVFYGKFEGNSNDESLIEKIAYDLLNSIQLSTKKP
jgi:hypothetical protein